MGKDYGAREKIIIVGWILISTLVALSAFFLFIRLNLNLGQSLIYVAIVAVVAGVPYAIIGLVNRLVSGSYGWFPWR